MFKRIFTLGFCAVLGYLVALGLLEVVSAWGLLPNREAQNAAARVRQVMLLVNKHSVDADKVKGDELADLKLEAAYRVVREELGGLKKETTK